MCVCARALRPDWWVVLRGLNYVWNTGVNSSIIKSKKRDELPPIPLRVHTSGGRRLAAAKSLDAGERGVTGIGAGGGGRGCAHQDGCGWMEQDERRRPARCSLAVAVGWGSAEAEAVGKLTDNSRTTEAKPYLPQNAEDSFVISPSIRSTRIAHPIPTLPKGCKSGKWK